MTLFRNRHTINFRCTAWLAVLAMMLPVFLPLVHHPAQAHQADMSMPHCAMHDDASEKNNDNSKSSSGKFPVCPICQGLHFFNNGFVPPTTTAFFVSNYIYSEVYVPEDQRIIQSVFPTSSWPRAPPFSV